MNSMNLKRHRSVTFVPDKHLARRARTPLVERCLQLKSEFDIDIYEVIKKKTRIEDSIPVHLIGDKIDQYNSKISFSNVNYLSI